MAKHRNQVYKLLSNEWSVPYWVLGLAALVLGAMSYVVQLVSPQYTGLFSNIMFLALIILLSIFYKKLYITSVEVTVGASAVELRYLKLVMPSVSTIPFSAIDGLGVDRTEAMKGLINVPEKNWLLIRRGKKKLYLYEQDGHAQIKGLFNGLRDACPDAERLQDVLK